jgi:hypothetical protein
VALGVEPLDRGPRILGLAEEAVLGDGDRGLVSERRQETDVVRSERAPLLRVDAEHADHVPVERQRDSKVPVKSKLDGARHVGGGLAPVLDEILDGQRLARRHDSTAQALADLDAGPQHDVRGSGAAGREHELIPLEQADAGGLGTEQPGGLLDEQREKLVGVLDGRHPPSQIVHHAQVEPLALRLLEAARVLEEHRDLRGDARDERLLPLRELSPSRPPHEVERARHPLVEHEGQDESGLVGEAAEELMAEARIGRHVIGQHRAALLPDGGVEPLFAQGQRRAEERLHQLLGHVIPRDGNELIGGAIVAVGGGGIGAKQASELAADQAERLGHFQGGVDGRRDRQQRFSFPQALGTFAD